MNRIGQAATIAKIAHEGQYYGALPYFKGHVSKVANRVAENPAATYGCVEVAYLHDVLEDTHVDVGDLLQLGVETMIVDKVIAVTRTKEVETYGEFIDRVIRGGFSPICVKMADLIENRTNCERTIMECEARVDRDCPVITSMRYEKAKSLLGRYNKAVDALRRADKWGLWEGFMRINQMEAAQDGSS